MSGPWWTLCAAVGAVVLVTVGISTLWFLACLCGAALRDRRAARANRYVPPEWVADEAARRHPSNWEDHQ